MTYVNQVIPQMSKINIKKLTMLLQDYNSSDEDFDDRTLNVINDLIQFKYQEEKTTKKTGKKFSNPVKILYVNEAVEMINLAQIIKDEDVIPTLDRVPGMQDISVIYKIHTKYQK